MTQIQKAVQILKRGGVVVYPTDTAYGLAVDATNTAAVEYLYLVKGRDFSKPIHVIFPSVGWLKKNVVLDILSLELMNEFLPGPLTCVLKLKSKNPGLVKISGPDGLGVRFPDNTMAQALVEALDRPITATSANISGGKTAYTLAEVRKQFAKSQIKPDLYLDGGKLPKVKPSTIVAIINNNVKILREGPISEKQIKRHLAKNS